MISARKLMKASAVTVLLATATTGAQGAFTGESLSFVPGGERGIRLRGVVRCTGCSLEEVKKGQPNALSLYQMTHKQGQFVMQVNAVNNPSRWYEIVFPPRVWVRGTDQLIQRLTAEENLSKEVEVGGLLSHMRTLDITDVAIKG